MRNKGFYIKSIIATGDGMKLSRVDFTRGCNLLFGPSDTGKSAVFSVIDFMLGKKNQKKSQSPRPVKEGKGYDTYYMEIVNFEDERLHTIRRKIGENKVFIKNCTFEQFEKIGSAGKPYPLTSEKNKTYSTYLMELNGFEDSLEIRNSNTSKERLTYSLIRHLILTSENRIISENPIFNPTGQFTNVKKEKSLIYYLTTGNDDSSFIESEKDEIRKSRYNGMISLTEDEIELIKDRLAKLGDADYTDFNEDCVIKAIETKLKEEEGNLNKLYNERKEFEDSKRRLESKRLFTTEFIKRMEILLAHYEMDLNRYEYLYEGASLFELIDKDHECPLCHSHIDSAQQINNEYLEAVQYEHDRLRTKIADVKSLISKKKQVMESILNQIEKVHKSFEVTNEKIRTFSIQLSSMKETLKTHQDNIEKKAEVKLLSYELMRLTKKLDLLNKQQKEKVARAPYNRQTDIKMEFCNKLKEKLVGWNLMSENEEVVFDEDGFDFIIGDKDRLSCGKGTRGVTCSAILMTLVEYCIDNDIPFSNLLVLDSPITAHYDDERIEADKTTQAKFFRYCNDHEFEYQLIVIDNKSPNEGDRSSMTNIHYIQFEKGNGFYQGKE